MTILRSSEMFDFTTQQGRMARELDKEISVKMDDVDLETIIFEIGDKEEVNFVADRSLEAFKQKLSVNFQKVRLGEFLEYIQRNFPFSFKWVTISFGLWMGRTKAKPSKKRASIDCERDSFFRRFWS